MAIRTLPFGYCISRGKACVVDAEAEIVRRIFVGYAEGHSYVDLTRWLNGQNTPYFPGKPWNKNAVARILQDERYLGSNTYPPILGVEDFGHRKPRATGRLDQPQIKDIRILAHCGVCGEPVRRERKNIWRCPICMVSAVPSTDQRLINDVSVLLRELCCHSDMVVIPDSENKENANVFTAENELACELEAAEFNESTAKTKVISLAAARFNALGSEDFETMRIQYILTRTEQNGDLDTELLRQITSAILIHPNGAVSLKLKNGQIIERTDTT